MVQFDAIWDTRATNSVITQDVVDACGLAATRMAKVYHVDGSSLVETYLVNIGLSNNVSYHGVRVTKGNLPNGADILIGMNIINTGDFAVTNFNGITKFSFRVPSVEHIDFVEETTGPQFQRGGKPKAKRPNPGDRGNKGKGKRKR